jgi:hypothetical protein
MNRLIIIILIIISKNLYSQNFLQYYEVINKAELANLNKKYVKADSLYNIAFALVANPFKEDFFLAALNADKLGKYKTVDEYLRRGSRKGLNFNRINKKIINFKKSKFWKDFKKDYDNLNREYLKNINSDFQKKISLMIKDDQASRNPFFGGRKKSKGVDNHNYEELQIIIKHFRKWPGFSLIGENTPKGKYDVTGNIALMLLHFNKEQIETLKPYMLEAVLRGEMYPYHYARIIDYTSSKVTFSTDSITGKERINQCYKYGTYLNEAVCNCEEAEKERKKIGFESLQDYYKKRNSSYRCIK